MLKEIKNIKIESNDYSSLTPVIKKYWLDATGKDGLLIRINKLNLDIKEQKKPEIELKKYLLPAFYQTIQYWKAIKPVGKIVSEKATYIIMNVVGENNTSTMQVFALKKYNEKYWFTLKNDDDALAILSNKAFIKILFEWMNSDR